MMQNIKKMYPNSTKVPQKSLNKKDTSKTIIIIDDDTPNGNNVTEYLPGIRIDSKFKEALFDSVYCHTKCSDDLNVHLFGDWARYT